MNSRQKAKIYKQAIQRLQQERECILKREWENMVKCNRQNLTKYEIRALFQKYPWRTYGTFENKVNDMLVDELMYVLRNYIKENMIVGDNEIGTFATFTFWM